MKKPTLDRGKNRMSGDIRTGHEMPHRPAASNRQATNKSGAKSTGKRDGVTGKKDAS